MIAKSLHPDLAPQVTEDEYSKYTEAYQILSSAEKRAQYDDAESARDGQVNIGRNIRVPIAGIVM